MIEIKKILCPTDFSDFSRRALDHALALAKWYAAEVSVLHVIPKVLMPPEAYPYLTEPLLPDPRARERAIEELGRFVHHAREIGVPTEIRLEEGDAVEEILKLAKQLPAHLVVMGTHGRRGFERLVLGSVAEKVLRKATCPVMTVASEPEGAAASEKALFKRILCPVDFSASSTRALEYALSLAKEADAHLTLLHVLEAALEEAGDMAAFALSEYRDFLKRNALERLKEAVPEDAREWCEPEFLVASGRSYRHILDVAKKQDTDLIVMGVQGRNAVDLALFGSTTHHVVREAKCPVLTIRSQ
jgi:nucleotide-binding universal stress UspA family protein